MTVDGKEQLELVRPSIIVGRLAHERVVAGLEQARALAAQDLAGAIDRVREIVRDVADRLDALELVRATTAGADASAQPASRLAVTTLATTRGEPVDSFLLIPFGEVGVERPIAGTSFVFTPAHALAAKAWFERMGRKLAIDYEHQSFERLNTRPDGLRPAAGWIGGLEVRDDGLWAVDVTWTDRARALLRAGEYRYFSPVIYWTDEDQVELAALGPVALTNDPAMRGVKPLAASRRDSDAAEREAGARGDGSAAPIEPANADAPAHRAEETKTPSATANAIVAVQTEDASAAREIPVMPSPMAHALERELNAARREVVVLRRQLALQEADAFVERGLRLGKILESTSLDWREDYLRDPGDAEARLSRAPVLLPPGRMLSLDSRGDAARRPQAAATSGEALGVEAGDLEAYERAVAAGRVLGRV